MTTASRELRQGLVASGVAGLAWSALCVALDQAGHTPSGPTLVDRWYRVQAVLVLVVVPLQAFLGDGVARWVARAPEPRGVVARAYGMGVLVFVLVDALAWAVLGFDKLGPVLVVSAPGCLLLMVAVGARGLVGVGVGWARAAGAVLLGVLAAVVVGGPLLR